MNCRGHQRRIDILNNYDITPIAHIKLLNGKVIPSDAGGDIEDSYFMFECTSRHNNHKEVIYCGRPTAKDFCEMTNQELPPLFNPLKEISGTSTGGDSKPKSTDDWNPVRKQLYIATMLLIVVWNGKPDTPLFKIKFDLENHTDLEPFFSYIKSINTMLRNKNTTMRNIIEQLMMRNNIKDYHFNLLVDKLKQEGMEQFFENE